MRSATYDAVLFDLDGVPMATRRPAHPLLEGDLRPRRGRHHARRRRRRVPRPGRPGTCRVPP